MDSHYDTLGLAQTASFDEVKAAYRRLAQKYHPDKNRHDPVRSAEMFTRVRRAYETLMSPESRRQHDDELMREAVFEAELARRRNAFSDARHAYASNSKGSASHSATPTDWHARAWDLVQRAPSADALARALRGEGCLPSLAAPLARDVAREYERLRQARENFDSATGQKPNKAAEAYANAQAEAGARADTASHPGASTSRQTSQAERASNRASGTQHKTRNMPFGNPTRPTRNMPFGTPRGASGSSHARFAWLIVAAMVLILIWRYSPSSRSPGLRGLIARSHIEHALDADDYRSHRNFSRRDQDDGSRRIESNDDGRSNALSPLERFDRGESNAKESSPMSAAPLEPTQQGQIKRLLPGVLPRFDNDGTNQRVIGAVGAFDEHASEVPSVPNVPSPDTEPSASDRP